MSIANTTRLERLEYRFEQMRLSLQQIAQIVAGLQSQLANLPQGQGGGGVPGVSVYEMAGVVIAAGSNVTGQTVYYISGASQIAISTNATVYNTYGAATVAGKYMTVGANGDGTYTVIAQSCT